MRRILVTGANKGIGLAIAKAILDEHEDTFVHLGSRDMARGRTAAATLGKPDRVDVVELDVADDRSVATARERLREPLYGLVNNAGIGFGAGLAEVLNVNTFGVHRVCEAFLPLLEPNGARVVNITSAAGPSFVAKCSAERQRFFQDGSIEWSALAAFLDECLAIAGDEKAFTARGLSDGAPYGLSKAAANLYTLILARKHPSSKINACTPGFIETDLTRHFVTEGKSAAELGLKPPSAGAVAPMHLLFGAVATGHYYGSDAKRSPLDRYRAPGAEPYTGD